jgi:hypothetical protein
LRGVKQGAAEIPFYQIGNTSTSCGAPVRCGIREMNAAKGLRTLALAIAALLLVIGCARRESGDSISSPKAAIDATTEALINRLPEISQAGYGYSAMFRWFTIFAGTSQKIFRRASIWKIPIRTILCRTRSLSAICAS